MKTLLGTAVIAAALFYPLNYAGGNTARTDADNSAVNQRDRNANEVTAESQNTRESDTELTRKIRQALVDDSTLSTYAKNIKIVTQLGRVTLKGPVNTAAEKSKIISLASEFAGRTSVVDQISVARSE